jgi:micrococcal nuclease
MAARLGPPMTPDLYVYAAQVTRVVDGDTVIADVDLGWHTWRHGERLRLARIDAPELGTEFGLEAVIALSRFIGFGGAARDIDPARVTIRTVKDRADNYGRMLAELFLADGRNINDLMLETGHAQPWPKKTP